MKIYIERNGFTAVSEKYFQAVLFSAPSQEYTYQLSVSVSASYRR